MKVKYLWIALLFILLLLIRLFEDVLFYDPYLVFFKSDFLTLDSPRREIAKLISFTALRYWLNSMISIAILYAFFKDKNLNEIYFCNFNFSIELWISLILFIFKILY